MLLFAAVAAAQFATAQRLPSREEAKSNPPPNYPYEARIKHITASGLAIARVDSKTGAVISVRISKSTGHRILDDSALAAFGRWRFVPGTSVVQIPISLAWNRPNQAFQPPAGRCSQKVEG